MKIDAAFQFRKEIIPCRTADYFDFKSAFPEDGGAIGLLPLLKRSVATNAPHFCSGNILFHGINGSNGCISHEHSRFQASPPVTPGVHCTSIFPVTNVQCFTDRFADETAQISFLDSQGHEVPIEWQPEGREWTPALVDESFIGGGITMKQRTAILPCDGADVLVCQLELSQLPVDWQVKVGGDFFRECSFTWQEDGSILGEIARELPDFRYNSGPWNGRPAPSTAVGTPFALYFDWQPPQKELPLGRQWSLSAPLTQPRLRIFFAAGFQVQRVAAAMAFARANADEFFTLAQRPVQRYFSQVVPAFSCSDKELERVYAEIAVTNFLSTIDVGYEPYHYPFTCPAAKIFWAWRMQFYHDSTFAGRSMLWLNDPKLCMNDLLQMCTVQYIHCTPRLGKAMEGQIECMPLVFNMLAQAALEFYNRTGDKEFLAKIYHQLLHFDRVKCRPQREKRFTNQYQEFPQDSWLFPFHHFDNDGDWLVESQLSGDDTCRGDEFQPGDQAKNWWDFPNPAVEPADINFYVLGNRRALLKMAQLLGDTQAVPELEEVIKCHAQAIQRELWDEESAMYTDITEVEHRRSHVPDAQNVTVPLYTGEVPAEHVPLLVEKIFQPQLFGTPLVLPSCPVNYTGIEGKTGFRPTGYWRGLTWGVMHYEAVIGLYRYGYLREAAFILHRFFDSMKEALLPAPENFNPLTREAVGAPFMGFSTQMIHPFLALTTGLQMSADTQVMEFNPVALDPAWEYFSFGPFQYKEKIALTVSWSIKDGYRVRVNDQEFAFARPTRFRLQAVAGGFALDAASVSPVEFQGRPPLKVKLFTTAGRVQAQLQSTTSEGCRGTIHLRMLELDKGLKSLGEIPFALEAGEEKVLTLPEVPGESSTESCWLLAEVQTEGYPLSFSEGVKVR